MKTFDSVTGASWLQGRKLLPLLRRHGQEAEGTVLDLGCGNSPWRPFFSRAAKYLRMDIYAPDDEVIVIQSPYDLPLDDGSVDTVLLSRMMGDVPDQSAFLKELARVLSPGGNILVFEAITYPLHDLPHDYWRVLPRGLEWMAGRHGLKVAEIVYCGGYFSQVSTHLNTFVFGGLSKSWLTRPIGIALRVLTNLACVAMDGLAKRPTLASDYFARIVALPPTEAQGS